MTNWASIAMIAKAKAKMKKAVKCPDCGHHFVAQIGGIQAQSIGVTRSRDDLFQFSLTAPKEMMETEKFFKVSEDMLVTGGLSLFAGGLCAFFVSVFEPDYTIYAGVIGSLGSVTYAWWWLIDERYQRLRRMPKMILEQWHKGMDLIPEANNEVTLTIDTRNEYDGYTSKYFGKLPVEVDRFNKWARAALDGQSIAIDVWTGGGCEFNRKTEYEPLLALMRAANVVKKLPGKGNTLTGPGRRALHQHLKVHPPTPA
jgi:hypothetical protein